MTAITCLPLSLAGSLFRSVMPYSIYDPEGGLLEGYRQCEINQVVMLFDDREAREKTRRDLRTLYTRAGLAVLHLPIVDFGVPDRVLCACAVRRVDESLNSGVNTVVHCHAGIGRTGLFTACLVKQILGVSGDAAIAWIRRYLPGAVENRPQQEFVHAF
jgi:protein-tyrosine phosphatase